MQNQQLPSEYPPFPIELVGRKPKENIAQQKAVVTNQKKITLWLPLVFHLTLFGYLKHFDIFN